MPLVRRLPRSCEPARRACGREAQAETPRVRAGDRAWPGQGSAIRGRGARPRLPRAVGHHTGANVGAETRQEYNVGTF